MLKLPEASDRGGGDTYAKEKRPSRQKEKSHFFSAVTSRVTTPC